MTDAFASYLQPLPLVQVCSPSPYSPISPADIFKAVPRCLQHYRHIVQEVLATWAPKGVQLAGLGQQRAQLPHAALWRP